MKTRRRVPKQQTIEDPFFPESVPVSFCSGSRRSACILIILITAMGNCKGDIWPFLNLCPHRGAFPMVPGCRVFCICLRAGGAGHLYACPEGYRFNHEQERCTPDGHICDEQQTCDAPSLLMRAITLRMTSPKRECQDMVGAYCANRWELVICHPIWTHELGIVDCDRKGDGTGICNLLTDACDKNRSSLWETLPGFDSALFGWIPYIQDGDNKLSDVPAINFCKTPNESETIELLTSQTTTEETTPLILLEILTTTEIESTSTEISTTEERETTTPTTTESEYVVETTTPTTTECEYEDETTTPTTTESEHVVETTTPTTTECEYEDETTTPTTTECEYEEETTTPTTTECEYEDESTTTTTTTESTTTEATTEFEFEDICHAIDQYTNVECASEGSWCLPDEDTLVTCGKKRMIRQIRSCRKSFATVGMEAACMPLVFGCSYWIENPTPDSWSPVSSRHLTDPQHEAYEAWFREHWCKTHGQQGVHCTPDGMSLAHCNKSLMVDNVFDCASVMPRGIMTGCQYCEQGTTFCVYRPRADLADKCGIPGPKDNHSAACGFTTTMFVRPPNIGILDFTSPAPSESSSTCK